MRNRRLDPLDEILRCWALLTQVERVAFLAAIAAPARPRPAAPDLRDRPDLDPRRVWFEEGDR